MRRTTRLATLLVLLLLLPEPALAKRSKGKKAKRGANFHQQRLEDDPRNIDAPGSITAQGTREGDAAAAAAAEVRAPKRLGAFLLAPALVSLTRVCSAGPDQQAAAAAGSGGAGGGAGKEPGLEEWRAAADAENAPRITLLPRDTGMEPITTRLTKRDFNPNLGASFSTFVANLCFSFSSAKQILCVRPLLLCVLSLTSTHQMMKPVHRHDLHSVWRPNHRTRTDHRWYFNVVLHG